MRSSKVLPVFIDSSAGSRHGPGTQMYSMISRRLMMGVAWRMTPAQIFSARSRSTKPPSSQVPSTNNDSSATCAPGGSVKR